MTRRQRGAPSTKLKFLCLEFEGGADVHRLAIAAVVLQRRQAIALDIVAHAASHGDAAGQGIGAADIERQIVAMPKCRHRAACGPFGADRNTGAETAAERIADAQDRALASTEGRIGALHLRDIARNGEPAPSYGN